MLKTLTGRVVTGLGGGALPLSLLAMAALWSPPAMAELDCDATPPGFWQRGTLLGSFDGNRTELCKAGVALGATHIDEVWGNTGGSKQGVKQNSRTELDLDVDFDPLIGLKGTTFHASGFWIQGGRMSKNLQNNMPISNIEAQPSLRLYTLWAEQVLFDETVNVRLGQLAADDEFAVSKLSSVLLNSTFGFPFLLANNLPNGGPAYPLATPGARIRVGDVEKLSWMGAVFSGDPAGKPGDEDPQHHNDSGTTFSFNGGTLFMSEFAYALNQEKNSKGLAGTYKVGGWYHNGRFNDLRYDAAGNSIAVSGEPGKPIRGNGGVYFVIDQMLTQGQRWSDEGFGVFLRGGYSPGNGSPSTYYVDGGVSYKGLIPNREEDTLVLGAAYAPVSNRIRGLEQDQRDLGEDVLIQSAETVMELSYQVQLTPFWMVQPDVQYIFHPGANAVDENGQRLKNEFVYGVRTALKF